MEIKGMRDAVRELGALALGSRLKRLAERLQADAARAHLAAGETMQPGQFPLLATLAERGPLSVGELAHGLGVSQPAVTRSMQELERHNFVMTKIDEEDRRSRQVVLTTEGAAAVRRLRAGVWRWVDGAATDLIDGLHGPFLEQLDEIERRLAQSSLADRIQALSLKIVDYSRDLDGAFHEINREWIEAMFVLEDHDREVLENPYTHIVSRGGDILFVESPLLGIIGTCALHPQEGGFTELTKMGVLEKARGLGAGRYVLNAVLDRAQERGLADQLFLLTNAACGPAIRLYEEVGFVHDQEIMDRFGARYARCDVAMRYCP